MGKRKGYNWKARQVADTLIDDRPTKKIKLDFGAEGTYDQSNALVLPSKKRKTKVKNKSEKITRILSNKQRKKLEKIVEKKDKKLSRASLLEELSKVQATPEELKQLTSIASVQTKGLKKINVAEKVLRNGNSINGKVFKLDSIKGAKRQIVKKEIKYDTNDPNILGFETSGESSSEDDESEEENRHNKVEENIEERENETSKICNEDTKVVSTASKDKNNENVLTETPNKIQNKDNINEQQKKIEKNIIRKPAVFVEVNRSNKIQKARLKLPILAEEQEIMEIINENSVIIIAGETGSGKTTQVPQFLYEAGYANDKMIGITEPRRIAATSMSKRVAEELNLSYDEVSYLIRFEGNVTDNTKIKFMTDGVLLRELKNDAFLTDYSVIILDEAHERSVYTDVLVGILSRIVTYREKGNNPLKLIIMSATLHLEDFTENKRLFKITPPVINVEARQFPVAVHFNRRTNSNYLKEALDKTIQIHTRLHEGGILVFVTGQREVNYLVRKLRSLFPLKRKNKVLEVAKALKEQEENEESSDDESFDQKMKKLLERRKKRKVKIVPEINLDDYVINEEENDSGVEDALSEDDDDNDCDLTIPANAEPLWVLPLYSFLPSDRQAKVFEPPPDGCRLCVVSTNVAETSLTIPNVKYVVDTGKTKEKLYDKITGATTYIISWTNKASAEQRAGRAGRMGPGHCYRLYSSAVFNDVFQEFSLPEIQRKPIDDLYLQMKYMNLPSVINFPFPTPPDLKQLSAAENRLKTLELLEERDTPLGRVAATDITPIGRVVAQFPVLPRFGKMLALSHQFNLLPYTICIVAALSVPELLQETPAGVEEEAKTKEKWAIKRQKWAGRGNSLLLGDPMILLRAICGAEIANSQGQLNAFCENNGLRLKAVLEVRKLRIQLTKEIETNIPNVKVVLDPNLPPPSDVQMKWLRQILLCGMGDQIAKKIDVKEIKDKERRRALRYGYMANDMEEPVFMHRGSVLFKDLPEYVVYQEMYETNKVYIRGITAIDPQWLPMYVSKLCRLSVPLLDPEPWFDEANGKVRCMVSGTFGRQAWPLPMSAIDYPRSMDLYKWFTKFFLQGKVFKKLEKYKDSLLTPADAITKPWGSTQPRIMNTLNRIILTSCRNREDVEDVWNNNPKFLLREYLSWLPDAAHKEVTSFWPPLNK